MIGVILAGGDGTRLTTSTGQNICKALRKINNRYLIEFSLDNLIELEISDAYIVIGKQGDSIKSAIGNTYKGLTIHYVRQPQQKGLVNAFVQVLNKIACDESIVLQLSDEIFVNLNIDAIKNAFDTKEFDFYCGVTPEENPEKIKNNFSVETDENSLLIKCVEKPAIVVNNIKGTGFSLFNESTQKVIKEAYTNEPDKLYDLCDCFNYLTASGYKGLAFSVAEREFNINTASDLLEIEDYLNN